MAFVFFEYEHGLDIDKPLQRGSLSISIYVILQVVKEQTYKYEMNIYTCFALLIISEIFYYQQFRFKNWQNV